MGRCMFSGKCSHYDKEGVTCNKDGGFYSRFKPTGCYVKMSGIALLFVFLVISTTSAWWDVTYTQRYNITNSSTIYQIPFAVNNNNSLNGWMLWTLYRGNCTNQMMVYNNSGTSFAVANDSYQCNWENASTLTGNNPKMIYPQDIKGWWHLENTSSYDSSQFSMHGTSSNTAAVTGVFGNALSFNGASSSISMGSQSAAGLNITTQLTICGWMNSTLTSGVGHVLSLDDGSSNRIFQLSGSEYYGGGACFYLGNASTWQGLCTNTGTAPSTNVWHHTCCTYNGSYMALYIDGVLNNSATNKVMGTVKSGSTTLYIGRQASNYHKGGLDEVVLWNRSLSASEIWMLYWNGKSNLTALSAAETYDATPPSISWNSPSSNNSYTLNASWIFWNVTVSEAPNACLLNINSTANYSMTISGSYCTYNLTGLVNNTVQKAIVYANDSSGNSNRTIGEWWATVNLTSEGPHTETMVLPSLGTTQKGANYTIQVNYSSNGVPLSGATCTLWAGFVEDVNSSLSYNASSGFYEASHMMGCASGVHPYTVTCSKVGYTTNTSSQNYTIENGTLGFCDYVNRVEFGNDYLIYTFNKTSYSSSEGFIILRYGDLNNPDWRKAMGLGTDPLRGNTYQATTSPNKGYRSGNLLMLYQNNGTSGTSAGIRLSANATISWGGCYDNSNELGWNNCYRENVTLWSNSTYDYRRAIKKTAQVINGTFSSLAHGVSWGNWSATATTQTTHLWKYPYTDPNQHVMGVPEQAYTNSWGHFTYNTTGWTGTQEHFLTNDTGGYWITWNNRSATYGFATEYIFQNHTTNTGEWRTWVNYCGSSDSGENDQGWDEGQVFMPEYGSASNVLSSSSTFPDSWFVFFPGINDQADADSDGTANCFDNDNSCTYDSVTQNQSFALRARNFFLGGTLGDPVDTDPPDPQFVSSTLTNGSYTSNVSWFYVNTSWSGEDGHTCTLDIYPNVLSLNLSETGYGAFEMDYNFYPPAANGTVSVDTEHMYIGRTAVGGDGNVTAWFRGMLMLGVNTTYNVTNATLHVFMDCENGCYLNSTDLYMSIYYNLSVNYTSAYCRTNASTKLECWNATQAGGTQLGNANVTYDNTTMAVDVTSVWNNDKDGNLVFWFKSNQENYYPNDTANNLMVDSPREWQYVPYIEYYPLSFQNISMTMDASKRYCYYNATGVNATTYQYRAWVNDTAGNMNLTVGWRYVTINLTSGADTAAPTITITTPANATTQTSSFYINATISETASYCSYTVGAVANVTMQGSGTAWWAYPTPPNQGLQQISVYCNDTSGNWGSNRSIWFTWDTQGPTIMLYSPEATTYNTSTINIQWAFSETPTTAYWQVDSGNNITNIACWGGTNITVGSAYSKGQWWNGSDSWFVRDVAGSYGIYHYNSSGSYIDNCTTPGTMTGMRGLDSNISTGSPTHFWIADRGIYDGVVMVNWNASGTCNIQRYWDSNGYGWSSAGMTGVALNQSDDKWLIIADSTSGSSKVAFMYNSTIMNSVMLNAFNITAAQIGCDEIWDIDAVDGDELIGYCDGDNHTLVHFYHNGTVIARYDTAGIMDATAVSSVHTVNSTAWWMSIGFGTGSQTIYSTCYSSPLSNQSLTKADGSYTFHAWATDSLGNLGHASASFTIDTSVGGGGGGGAPPILEEEEETGGAPGTPPAGPFTPIYDTAHSIVQALLPYEQIDKAIVMPTASGLSLLQIFILLVAAAFTAGRYYYSRSNPLKTGDYALLIGVWVAAGIIFIGYMSPQTVQAIDAAAIGQ